MVTAIEQKLRRAPGRAELRLQPGDTMTSAEFLRRAEACDGDERVELIDGIVFMFPPLSTEHAAPDSIIGMWLSYYVAYTEGTEHYPNTTLIIDGKSTVQPDSILCTTPQDGSRLSITKRGRYLSGTPELVCEIANSSVSIDLHRKLEVYQRAGVQEYLVWRIRDKVFDWFVNERGSFIPQKPNAAGLLSSRVFSGLVLDTHALLAFNRAAILRGLEKALGLRDRSRRRKG
jgi:Uma2 family endonuclease